MVSKKFICVITAVGFIAAIAGCATIMQGTTQSVGISSTPTNATVTINNVEKGKTPIVVDLKRKDHHIVKIEMSGYLPYEATFTRSASGWVFGNIVFGGLIGLAVDAISGGVFKFTPIEITAVLQKQGGSAFYRKDFLYVAVVLQPDPAWEKIGQLEKKN